MVYCQSSVGKHEPPLDDHPSPQPTYFQRGIRRDINFVRRGAHTAQLHQLFLQ